MPISLNQPSTITIDKLRIDQFTISPKEKSVTIHFSKGYEDAGGNFIPKEYNRADLKDVEFDHTMYESVKNSLYSLLSSYLEGLQNEVNLK